MFSSGLGGLLLRISDAIDDMLLGDYDYVVDGDRLYADVDYYRKRANACCAIAPERRPTIPRRGARAANRAAAAPALVRR